MPLYEYRCVKCGSVFEKIQRFSDAPLTTCEKCGGRLEKLLSSAAIQFKGSGWYVTDYPRKGSTAPSPSTPSSSSDGQKASSESKESKKPAETAPKKD